jgi:hypothetical protein
MKNTTSKDDMTLIKDYPHYSVSRNGEVYSWATSRILKQSNRGGYRVVTLSSGGVAKTHTVHRLVAKAFLENGENKRTVNHINGIKHDNRVENLEWATYAENERHSFDVLGKTANNIGVHKSHCIHGHPYSGDNLRIGTDGRYICKSCIRNNRRRYLTALKDKQERK